jgi:hypothetical protein
MPSVSAAHVGERIVDEHEFLRLATPLEQDLVDARIGLRDAYMARDHARVELFQEVVQRFGHREFGGRIVAERVNRPACGARPAEQRHVLLDRPIQRLES